MRGSLKYGSAYIATTIKSIIYGMTILFTGHLLRTIEVFDVLALRFLISALAFVLLKITGIIKISFKGKNLKYILLAALFEPCLEFIFETYGVKYTTTVVAGTLTAIAPVMTIILETVFLNMKTNLKQRSMLSIRIIGALIITFSSGSTGHNTWYGMIFILLSAFSGSCYTICSRKSSQDFNAFEISFCSNVIGAIVFNAINIVRRAYLGTLSGYFIPFTDTNNIVGFLYLGVLSSVVAMVLGNYALSKIQPSLSSVFGGLTTLTSILSGVIFNKEYFAIWQFIGLVCILVGIIGMSFATEKKDRENDLNMTKSEVKTV